MITMFIDGQEVQARPGWTVLETARHNGFYIPTLCYHEAVSPSGVCRMCLVELGEGEQAKLVASCMYPVAEGIKIYTDTDRVRNVRRWILEMLLSECPASKEIRDMAARYDVTGTRFEIENPDEQCMLCGLCTRVCTEVVGLAAISTVSRGVHKKVGAPFLRPTEVCVECGCCVTICPTNAMQARIDSVRGVS
ncbi:MAG: 2Fe-2S iron-sulfur cluster-binding protein [Desulfovermiculus sp.]